MENTSLAVTDNGAHIPQSFLKPSNLKEAMDAAKFFAGSQLVPPEFQNKPADIVLSMDIAERIGGSFLAVLQGVNIIHSRPTFSGLFIAAMLNTSGKFTPIRYDKEEEGLLKVNAKYLEYDKQARRNKVLHREIEIENISCVAYAFDLGTGDELRGPKVDVAMAAREGWYLKSDSKWQTMPEVMLHYRSVSMFGKIHAPELLLGLKLDIEVEYSDPKPVDSPGAEGLSRFENSRNQDVEIEIDEGIDEKFLLSEKRKIDKIKTSIALDKFRQSHNEIWRSNYNSATYDAIVTYTVEVYAKLKDGETKGGKNE